MSVYPHQQVPVELNKTAEYLPGSALCSGLSEGGGTSRGAWNHETMQVSEKAVRSEGGVSAKGRWKEAFDAE
jgi:hypothetical protein